MRSYVPCTAVALLISAACGPRDKNADADQPAFLANLSAEGREALSTPVSFALNEQNFSEWEIAERNLDRIPASEFTDAGSEAGSPVDRAIARLERSPGARSAIEASGLPVRDFVLETIALAQAVAASQTSRSAGASGVSPGNFAFVERYRERIRLADLGSGLARQSGDSQVTDSATAAELTAANAAHARDSAAAAADTLADSGRRKRDSTRDTIPDRAPGTPR